MVAFLKQKSLNDAEQYQIASEHLREQLKDKSNAALRLLLELCLENNQGFAAFCYLHELHLREIERTQ